MNIHIILFHEGRRAVVCKPKRNGKYWLIPNTSEQQIMKRSMNIRDNRDLIEAFKKITYALKWSFSTKDDFCPQVFCNVERHLLVVTTELGVTGLFQHSVGRGQGCC